MARGYESENTRYQLRFAAGVYWLLDMSQSGYPYRPPLPMNEVGARIWGLLEKGMNQEQISVLLAGEYDVCEEEIMRDVMEFCDQLSQKGIKNECFTCRGCGEFDESDDYQTQKDTLWNDIQVLHNQYHENSHNLSDTENLDISHQRIEAFKRLNVCKILIC